MWLTGPLHRPPRAGPQRVSILVVVDVAHRQVTAQRGVQVLDDVSILVVVDVAHRPVQPLPAAPASDAFQSLLWWMWLTGSRIADSEPGIKISFNPCCGGCGSPARSGPTTSRIWISFNPCCGGCGSPAPVVRPQSLRLQPGFNPCCGGCGSPALPVNLVSSANCDVSILVVVDVAHRHWPP